MSRRAGGGSISMLTDSSKVQGVGLRLGSAAGSVEGIEKLVC
jgi:hypothetical protein